MTIRQEGVSKFALHYVEKSCLTGAMIAEIESWRAILHRLRLIGRSADRYGGHGYGNISIRQQIGDTESFIISGTQTGGLPVLSAEHYALVTDCDPTENVITAHGTIKPSSEALTHGQLYRLDGEVRCVVHGHCPEIWQRAAELRLPATSAGALYGTPEMAQEVERMFSTCRGGDGRVIVMGGHLDGVISFGQSPAQAVMPMIDALARALACREAI